MDLNQLYFEHQSLQMKADAAISSDVAKMYHRDACQVAGQIGRMQHIMGAAAAAGWTATASKNALDGKAARLRRSMPGYASTSHTADVDRHKL